MLKVGFIGAGTVGTALAFRLRERGYPVIAVSSRSPASAQRLADMVQGCQVIPDGQGVAERADLVFITTPDNAISQVASSIRWHPGQKVVHCSGADSLDILQPALERGAQIGGFHPLQTLASINQAIHNIPGSFFAIEAEGELKEVLTAMVTALGGQWVELKAGDKALYHLSAVLACNYFVTLVKLATDIWQRFGVSTPQAITALLPLLKGTLNNLTEVGLPQALTGPIARGDSGTIRKHLKALESSYPHLIPVYQELGLHTIPIALAKGRLKDREAEELRQILSAGGVKHAEYA